jgi:hypothetical protein
METFSARGGAPADEGMRDAAAIAALGIRDCLRHDRADEAHKALDFIKM